MSVVTPSRSTSPAADHHGFFTAVQEAFKLHLKAQSVPVDWHPVLVEDHPKDREGKFDTSFDVITFRVIESKTGATSPDGARRPDGLFQHGIYPHPQLARYHQVVTGWWEDVVVEFVIHAKSNSKANQLVLWFHRMMMTYGHGLQFFRARGVPKFKYVARLEDEVSDRFGQELYLRRLRYQIRLQFLNTLDQKDLEEIHVAVQSSGAQHSVAEFGITLNDGE